MDIDGENMDKKLSKIVHTLGNFKHTYFFFKKKNS
jgi:hypothetical protein